MFEDDARACLPDWTYLTSGTTAARGGAAAGCRQGGDEYCGG